ncbi:MAG: ABC transporter permease [Actinomyces sp.]|nr:ABC transporter permease [Actinomyces sp.]MCI1642052.1 ABC transporter permease [Actinomyces sp.]MCI1661506.1 ABC transporter permease [Actinomyces sp.]MCI1690831.1 ABC transporter permease [Actinomyces sp.]MCI1788823.1 ABC transporter permease [Actinomyces sp.]MCI1830101.1 ABC transporter permease [Actinomyces sp.]
MSTTPVTEPKTAGDGVPAGTEPSPRRASAQRSPGATLQAFVRKHSSQVLVVVSELILIAGFSIASPYFLQISNFSALLLDASVYILLALGLTFVIATGGIDLTPGFGIAFTSVCLALVMTKCFNAGLPVWLCVTLGVLAGVLSGALMGSANGVMVAYLRMQPMIATLAMMLVAWGLAMVLSGTSAIPLTQFPGFLLLGQGRAVGGITNAVWLCLIAAIIAAFLLNKTLIGRYALAMGSNEEATRLSGVNVTRWKFRVYALAGSFTGLAGVLMASRLASGKPDVGQSYEMYAIAAAVLGGASLLGGRASVFGSVVGAILIATIRNGAVLMGIPDQWQKVLLGVVVLAAVYLDVRRKDR